MVLDNEEYERNIEPEKRLALPAKFLHIPILLNLLADISRANYEHSFIYIVLELNEEKKDVDRLHRSRGLFIFCFGKELPMGLGPECTSCNTFL